MKKTNPSIKGIVYGSIQKEELERVKEKYGFDGSIEKPYQTSDLSAMVIKILST